MRDIISIIIVVTVSTENVIRNYKVNFFIVLIVHTTISDSNDSLTIIKRREHSSYCINYLYIIFTQLYYIIII